MYLPSFLYENKMSFGIIRFKLVLRFCDFIEIVKIILLAIESTYFKFITREINDKYFL